MATISPAQNCKNGLFEESWLKELGRNTNTAWQHWTLCLSGLLIENSPIQKYLQRAEMAIHQRPLGLLWIDQWWKVQSLRRLIEHACLSASPRQGGRHTRHKIASVLAWFFALLHPKPCWSPCQLWSCWRFTFHSRNMMLRLNWDPWLSKHVDATNWKICEECGC